MMIVKSLKLKKIHKGNSLLIILLSTALFLSGCATSTSSSKANYKLATVHTVLATAKENRAHEYAPRALNEAEERLRSAETAIAKGKHANADALLDEALMTAKYAEAKSEAARAKERVTHAREMIDTLRHEMLLSN